MSSFPEIDEMTVAEKQEFSRILEQEDDKYEINVHFYFPDGHLAEPFGFSTSFIPRKGDIVSISDFGFPRSAMIPKLPKWKDRRDRSWRVKDVYFCVWAATTKKDILLKRSKIYGVEVYLKPVIYWKTVLKTPWWRLCRYIREFKKKIGW